VTVCPRFTAVVAGEALLVETNTVVTSLGSLTQEKTTVSLKYATESVVSLKADLSLSASLAQKPQIVRQSRQSPEAATLHPSISTSFRVED